MRTLFSLTKMGIISAASVAAAATAAAKSGPYHLGGHRVNMRA